MGHRIVIYLLSVILLGACTSSEDIHNKLKHSDISRLEIEAINLLELDKWTAKYDNKETKELLDEMNLTYLSSFSFDRLATVEEGVYLAIETSPSILEGIAGLFVLRSGISLPMKGATRFTQLQGDIYFYHIPD